MVTLHGEVLLSCRYTGFVNGKRYLPWQDSDVDELKQVTKLPGTYKGVLASPTSWLALLGAPASALLSRTGQPFLSPTSHPFRLFCLVCRP